METMHLLDDEQGMAGAGGITGEMMSDLVQTSKWLRYLGILGMASCTFLVLVVFILLFTLSGINDQGMYPQNGVYIAFLFFISFFLIAGFVSLLLYRYGNNLKKYSIHKEIRFLEEAIEINKNLWLTLGVSSVASFLSLILIGFFTSV